MKAIRFEFGQPDRAGKRVTKAFHGDELLAQERLDPLQDWQTKSFIDRATGALPITNGFSNFEDAVVLVKSQFSEAVSKIPAVDEPDKSARPVLQPMADIQAKEIDWLWPNRLALGKLSLIIGDPGNGKSFWSLDLAARISTGCKWPDDCGNSPIGSVVLMGVEDDLADTVKPRLEAAGADVSKIVALTGVANKDADGEFERTVDLRRDIPVLEAALQQVADPRAMIIDPISAFMGKTDSHVNAEVRETLAPLSLLAERYSVAIIAITHLRKGETAALHRAMGSVAFTAAARSVWAIAKDKNDPEGRRRLLLPVKSNISEDQGGLAFTLAKRHGLASSMPHIEYAAGPVTDTNADEALSPEPRKRGRPAEERGDAEQFLRDALADGPRLAKDVEDEAVNGHCISRGTLKRARETIGVVAWRPVNPGPWHWRLPDGAEAQSTSAPDPYTQELCTSALVGKNTGENGDFDGQESTSADSFYTSNGHDPEAVNRLFAEAGEDYGGLPEGDTF